MFAAWLSSSRAIGPKKGKPMKVRLAVLFTSPHRGGEMLPKRCLHSPVTSAWAPLPSAVATVGN